MLDVQQSERHDERLQMTVSELIANWSVKRWASDEGPYTSFPPTESENLRLRWFGSPDDEGWFRIIATDSDHRDWSTFCRLKDLASWPALERALVDKLDVSLAELAHVELGKSAQANRRPIH
jgi:hypothetical protein